MRPGPGISGVLSGPGTSGIPGLNCTAMQTCSTGFKSFDWMYEFALSNVFMSLCIRVHRVMQDRPRTSLQDIAAFSATVASMQTCYTLSSMTYGQMLIMQYWVTKLLILSVVRRLGNKQPAIPSLKGKAT